MGITGAVTPEDLKAIAAAPYALPAEDCGFLSDQIAQLDAFLGPDVDAPPEKPQGTMVGRAAGRAIGGAARGVIPYRWALRWLTQANKKDKELQLAILAGAARRGFLKGVQRGMGCPAPAPSTPH